MAPGETSGRDRLVVPPDRRGLSVRLGFALLFAVLGAALSLSGWLAARPSSLVGGLVLLGFFVLAALATGRRLRRAGPLLVVDREGVAVDDHGRTLRVGWDDVVGVRCLNRFLRRGVLLRLRVDAAPGARVREVLVGAEHLQGAPPEWLAGMLETFRSRPDLRARLGSTPGAGGP